MPEASGNRRRRLFVVAAVVALCACGLGVSAASGGVTGARANTPELNIIYTSVPSLQVKLGDGTVVRSGGVVPAGSYTVLVFDDGDYPNPRFTFTGPGVSVNSDLNTTGMGIDALSSFGPYTFQAGASYRIQDTNIGASSLFTFTIGAASGSSGSSGSGAGGQSSGGGNSSTVKSSSSSGSSQAKMMGTLKGSISVSGKPTLTLGGKAVQTLKAGRYTITVGDQSKTAGLIVGQASKPAITLSGAASVGTSSRTVTLSAGKWFFEASTRGPKTHFSVTK